MTTPDIAQALDDALAQLLGSDAPLATRLANYATILRDLNRPFAEAVDRLVARLLAADAGRSAPKVGDVLPDFVLPSDAGHLISLGELLAHGQAV